MMKDPKKTISVVLPLKLYTKLKEESKKNCRSLSAQIRQILIERFRP